MGLEFRRVLFRSADDDVINAIAVDVARAVDRIAETVAGGFADEDDIWRIAVGVINRQVFDNWANALDGFHFDSILQVISYRFGGEGIPHAFSQG